MVGSSAIHPRCNVIRPWLVAVVVGLGILAACSPEKKPRPTDGDGTGGTGGTEGVAPHISSFVSSAEWVRAGRSVSLSWVVDGTGPILLTMDGAPIPVGLASMEVEVIETRTFRLVAENDFGTDSAEVQVIAKPLADGIFPAEAEVDPGEAQRFYATRADVRSSSSSCGVILRSEVGTVVWQAPDRPEVCELELVYDDAVAVASITVKAATPTVTGIEGLSGPSDVPGEITRTADGTWVANGYRLITEFDLTTGTWTSPLAIAGFAARRILSGPDGTIHAVGEFDNLPSWLRKRPGGAWEILSAPDLAAESSDWGAAGVAVSPDGKLCVSILESGKNAILCETQGSWSTALALQDGVGITALGFTDDGLLHFSSYDGAIFSVDQGERSRVGDTAISRTEAIAFLDDALHVAGEGVFRWDEGSWTDLSEGLPSGTCRGGTTTGRCVVESLVEVDGDLFALSNEGLYGKSPGGTFVRVADPPPNEVNFFGGLMVADSRIWMGTTRGLWSTTPWSDEWELHTLSGADFGRHPTALAFRDDGTIAYAAESFANDNDPVLVLSPGAAQWTKIAPGSLPTYHHVRSLAYRDDGALAIGTNRVGGGVGNTGLLFFSPPGNESYEPMTQDGLPPWTTPKNEDGTKLTALRWAPDGALLAAIDGEGVFRLAPGAESWAPLGPPLRANDLLLVGERILVATRGDVVELSDGAWTSVAAARFPDAWRAASHVRLAAGSDGALWSASTLGVFTLPPSGTWTPAASGECSVSSLGVFAGGGRIYCASEGRIAEVHDGRWTRIPALRGDGLKATPIEAGPDGALYLDLNPTLRGSLVRTLP